ncbi:MAG TPA: SGNH/GDSL hydrolase family protein [Steroidobacteraceae bacterium]|jgi:hypothetical protein
MPEQSPDGRRLTKRDYALLALTVILTLAFIASVSEIGARYAWPEQADDSCETWDGDHGKVMPNCRSVVKTAEGQWVEYRYNECGFRSAAPCGPKPRGSLRVVVIGTSVSRGYWVSYHDSFSGRLEQDLSHSCQRPVEFQNLSVGVADGPIWHNAALEAPAALRLDPDAIVLVVSNFDLIQYTAPAPSTPGGSAQRAPFDPVGKLGELRQRFASDSRAMTMAMHFAFSDPDRYLRFFVQHVDSADYLRTPLSPAWRFRLETVDKTIGPLAAAARAAHVPIFLLLAPARPTVLLAHDAAEFPNLDPREFPKALAGIAHQHGAVFVDPTSLDSRSPNWDRLFFVADGHPNAEGHRLMASALRSALAENVPALRACATSPSSPGPSARPLGAIQARSASLPQQGRDP